MLAVVNLMSYCGLHRRLRGALIGQLATVELSSPLSSQRMVRVLRAHGCGARAEHFYAEHVVADAVHERVMREAIAELITAEPDLLADVVFGIRAASLLDQRLDEHLRRVLAGGPNVTAPTRAGELTAVSTVTLRIGTSGWQYRDWRGVLYPAKCPTTRWLGEYAQTFDTVENNNAFYRLPESDTFAKWRDATPPGFLMAVKASRFLTHIKRLRDPAEPVERLVQRVDALGNRLGPVLLQLPPTAARRPGPARCDAARIPRPDPGGGGVPARFLVDRRDPAHAGEARRRLRSGPIVARVG